jgi:ribonuclease T2
LIAFTSKLRIALFAAAALHALVALALAKDDDCVFDRCANREKTEQKSPAETGLRRGGSGGDFDFYVLALSWSAGFCVLDANHQRHMQCDAGSNLGFVVHGLWPLYERGFPSDCDGATSPSRIALDRVKGVFPDEGLARYEWRKHGTCSGRSPSDYFADVARAKEGVTIPKPFTASSAPQTYSPIDVERAFIAANPRLRPGMLAIGCRKGVLQDVKICFSKDLREFHACPEIARQSCHAREISVPAPL